MVLIQLFAKLHLNEELRAFKVRTKGLEKVFWHNNLVKFFFLRTATNKADLKFFKNFVEIVLTEKPLQDVWGQKSAYPRRKCTNTYSISNCNCNYFFRKQSLSIDLSLR